MNMKMSKAEAQKAFYEQETQRSADLEAATSSAHNWYRVVQEKPKTIFSSPVQAAKAKSGQVHNQREESEGEKILGLWQKRGMEVSI
ncbi:hypothetical protein LJB81_04490 [Desulfovibrio sp. OttesenSCG-928-M14]|nr:hypothetical protein [Desulfovibrio sp. OttesenSCG-928-M14]